MRPCHPLGTQGPHSACACGLRRPLPAEASSLRLWGGSPMILFRSPRCLRATGFSHTDSCVVGLKKKTRSSPVQTTHLLELKLTLVTLTEPLESRWPVGPTRTPPSGQVSKEKETHHHRPEHVSLPEATKPTPCLLQPVLPLRQWTF